MEENKVNLHILNIRANMGLQNPTFPVTYKQALTTFPDKMQRAIFRLWGSVFLKLWQHLPLKKKFFRITHSISFRYSSSKTHLDFNYPVGTVWCSTLAIAFSDFTIWRFISNRMNIGIFSSEVPHPELENCTNSLLSVSGSELVPCFSFLWLYILWGSGSTTYLSLPVRTYL